MFKKEAKLKMAEEKPKKTVEEIVIEQIEKTAEGQQKEIGSVTLDVIQSTMAMLEKDGHKVSDKDFDKHFQPTLVKAMENQAVNSSYSALFKAVKAGKLTSKDGAEYDLKGFYDNLLAEYLGEAPQTAFENYMKAREKGADPLTAATKAIDPSKFGGLAKQAFAQPNRKLVKWGQENVDTVTSVVSKVSGTKVSDYDMAKVKNKMSYMMDVITDYYVKHEAPNKHYLLAHIGK